MQILENCKKNNFILLYFRKFIRLFKKKHTKPEIEAANKEAHIF